MLTKNQIKSIKSLQSKKTRTEKKLFVVEGVKMVGELLHSGRMIHSIYATKNWFEEHEEREDVTLISIKELLKISNLSTPNEVVAIVPYLTNSSFSIKNHSDKLILGLDNVSDPGNLGTIIRIADWFGIETIICSKDTVDVYNPKTIQSTMGSIFRVNLHYADLEYVVTTFNENQYPVYAAVLNGSNLYKVKKTTHGMLLMGSESHGILDVLLAKNVIPITIPSFGKAESLNVAVSTAIICGEFRRERS